MLFILIRRLIGSAAFLALVSMLVAVAGCSTYRGPPCAANACDDVARYRQDRDPFPIGPISFGSIFGPQPNPGRVTVEK